MSLETISKCVAYSPHVVQEDGSLLFTDLGVTIFRAEQFDTKAVPEYMDSTYWISTNREPKERRRDPKMPEWADNILFITRGTVNFRYLLGEKQ